MDLDDPLLSHQVEAVNSLASFFENVTVVTGKSGRFSVEKNVSVFSSSWQSGKPLTNVINFLRLAIPEAAKADIVFSHMTEVQTFLIAPFTKIRRIPHYLWYAHAHPSKYLLLDYLLVNGIITSTPGSCPIRSERVFKIGQAIDTRAFYREVPAPRPIIKFCHVGRFDSAKGILEIIHATASQRPRVQNLHLTLVGSPSNQEQQKYASFVKAEAEELNYSRWITFTDAIKRELIPDFLAHQDVFVHAYQGSLDKTLIEATIMGLPVVTLNAEYLAIFGSWSKISGQGFELNTELNSLLEMDEPSRIREAQRRQALALSEHSLSSWSMKLSNLLQNSLKSN